MNALISFLTSPLFVRLLSAIAEKFIEWETTQKKAAFKEALRRAIETGDQRMIDGGMPSGKEGVVVKK